jgi:midasin
MIGVDDSKSIANTGATELLQMSVALITGALTRLQVGQIGLMKFGEFPQLLHPFNVPFRHNILFKTRSLSNLT